MNYALGSSQFALAADDAHKRPRVQKLQAQLERLEAERHAKEVDKQEAMIVADLRKRIQELGGTPCE